MNKKLIVSIIGGLLLLAGLGAGLFLVKQQQDLRDKAAPATSLSFSPASPSIGVGETANVSVQINTSSNTVSALDIDIGFDASVISVEKLTFGADFPVTLTSSQISNTAGTAKITVGASPSTPFQGTGIAAVITIKGKGQGSSKLEFNDGTRAAGQQESGNVIAFKSPATVTVKAAGQPAATIITPTTTATGTSQPSATLAPAAGGPAATLKPTATVSPKATTSPSSTAKPTVSLPSNKTVVPGATITGTAAPNSTVTITIQSDPITATVKASSAGKWSYTLPINLEPGTHTLTVTDSNGTYTTQFTVASAIPQAGFSLPLFATIFIGFSLLIFGAFVNIRSRNA